MCVREKTKKVGAFRLKEGKSRQNWSVTVGESLSVKLGGVLGCGNQERTASRRGLGAAKETEGGIPVGGVRIQSVTEGDKMLRETGLNVSTLGK